MANKLPLGALGLGSATIITAYISKQYLDRSCPRIPISKVSQLSACRQLVDTACDSSDDDVPKPWGGEKSGPLPSWSEASSGDRKSRWLSSYVAVQVDVPVALLESYTSEARESVSAKSDKEPRSADGMARNLIAAFLDARSTGPDGWLIDRNVPPRTYMPGSHLFGEAPGLSAFMFDSWSSTLTSGIQPTVLPASAPVPSSFFPSNEALLASRDLSLPESAGTVIYWKFPVGAVNAFNKAASYGWPWRVMEGGWQEFIVEKISEETARVTYVALECSDLHPGDQTPRDFKRMPWLAYEAHVLYAQSLLLHTVRQLRKAE
ncbi:uncharacterized protein N7484_001904 [Penicillium longicatenatum]|uniref:uncharacterized protein n=1 Tax=Penicillium longicatenatum TaxID=1561947 RepID=UPI0025480EB4|nr:uncharacterized protein N7484_001904 [Penicillium longicatenatum]KAJ5658255.1 hypothetical protein N7484_001904 [Penicillium longicatenatum]